MVEQGTVLLRTDIDRSNLNEMTMKQLRPMLMTNNDQ